MSFGFGFALPAYPLRGGGGNNPFNQSGPTLDLSFAGVVTNLSDPNGYTLTTDFIVPQYQVAAQYTIWETGVGLVDKTFGDIITFTRATSATFTGSNGLIQSAAIDAPRFDYDPVTLAAKGLLIEEQRTNLFLQSQTFDVTWNRGALNTTGTPPWINAGVAPDGTTTADALIPDTTNTNHYLQQSITRTTGNYTFSVYAKANGYNFIGLQIRDLAGVFKNVEFNVSTGVVVSSTGAVASSIQSVGNGWYRCIFTFDSATGVAAPNDAIIAGSTAGNFNAGFAGDGTSGILLWGAQLEAGSFATSYIPTVASQVTRALDAVSVNTLSPWFNASEGTLFAQGSVYAQISGGGNPIGIASITDQTANNRLTVGFSNGITSNIVRLVGNGVSVLSTTGGTAAVNSASKIAAAYKTGDSVGYASGVQTGVSATAFTFSPTIMLIGNYIPVTDAFCGHIRRITYYPRRLSNAELQAITA